jgi:hypothetical protein
VNLSKYQNLALKEFRLALGLGQRREWCEMDVQISVDVFACMELFWV